MSRMAEVSLLLEDLQNEIRTLKKEARIQAWAGNSNASLAAERRAILMQDARDLILTALHDNERKD